MTVSEQQESPLMTPGEVAREFGVDPKTVSRWANADRLAFIRTAGGHRRFRRDSVLELLERGSNASTHGTTGLLVDASEGAER